MKRLLLLLLLLVQLLHACAPSANVVSNQLIQKRKYYAGWQVNLHRSGNNSRKHIDSKQLESSATKEHTETQIRREETHQLIPIAQNSIAESIPIVETKTIAPTDSLNVVTPNEPLNPTGIKKYQSKELSIVHNPRFNPILKSKKSKDPKPVLSQEMKRAKIIYFALIALIIIAFLSFPFLNLALSGIFGDLFSKLFFSICLPIGLMIFAYIKMKKNDFYVKVIKPKNQKKAIEKQKNKHNDGINNFIPSAKLKKLKRESLFLHLTMFGCLIAIPFSIYFAEILGLVFAIAFILLLILSQIYSHQILNLLNQVPIEEHDRRYKNQRANTQIALIFKYAMLILSLVILSLVLIAFILF